MREQNLRFSSGIIQVERYNLRDRKTENYWSFTKHLIEREAEIERETRWEWKRNRVKEKQKQDVPETAK